MEVEFLLKLCVSLALVGMLGLFLRLYNELVRNPERLRSMVRKQGIGGPPPTAVLGNLMEVKKSRDLTEKPPMHGAPAHHNCANELFPFFDKWQKQYGDIFIFSFGNIPILHVTQPDFVRELITCTSLDLGKPSYFLKVSSPMVGQGVLSSNGPFWAHQRKIIAPEFYMNKVKGMIHTITECAATELDSWNREIETHGGIADIKIDHHMRSFSGNVLSRICLGSDYSKGAEIASKIKGLLEITSNRFLTIGVPLISYLPTESNRKAWELQKQIRTLVLEVSKERNEAGYEKDFLQTILQGAKNSDLSQDAIDRFIVDNCKNMYVGGYDSVACSASWCLMLLASNPEWQDRVRAEVLQVCGGKIPDADMISKLKQVTMVIHESLRLYPPAFVVSREALNDMKFQNINIPKGFVIWVLVTTLHTNPEIWGPDSYEFNPERFANGINGACKFPQMYMPFGYGSRICLGQNLVMVQLKILIALIVSNFSFSLSPKYIHSPAHEVAITPKHGVNLLVKKL